MRPGLWARPFLEGNSTSRSIDYNLGRRRNDGAHNGEKHQHLQSGRRDVAHPLLLACGEVPLNDLMRRGVGGVRVKTQKPASTSCATAAATTAAAARGPRPHFDLRQFIDS